MKMKISVTICFFLPFILDSVKAATLDESCENPLSQCIVINECEVIYKQLKSPSKRILGDQQLRKLQCGITVRGKPKVCCPSSANNVIQGADNSASLNNVNKKLLEEKRKLLPQDCGDYVESPFVGPKTAGYDQFPWLALLEYDTPQEKGKTACGGSLINDRYVLTAAHCVTGLPSNWKLARIRLAEYDTRTIRDCVEEVCLDELIQVPIEKVIAHPSYSATRRQNDIALVRLAKNLPPRNYVKSVCLPLQPSPNSIYQVAGWGKALKDEGRNIPTTALWNANDQKFCAQSGLNIFKNQLCLKQGSSVLSKCVSDEGGPLMGAERARKTVYGVYSFTGSPNNRCSKESPAVFTEVIDYVPWILMQLEK